MESLMGRANGVKAVVEFSTHPRVSVAIYLESWEVSEF